MSQKHLQNVIEGLKSEELGHIENLMEKDVDKYFFYVFCTQTDVP